MSLQPYQTPRQALLSSITTFNKDSLGQDPQGAVGGGVGGGNTLLAGIVPPRDLHRPPPPMPGPGGVAHAYGEGREDAARAQQQREDARRLAETPTRYVCLSYLYGEN